MANEAAPALANAASGANGGHGSAVSLAEMQMLLATLAAQMEQLCKQSYALTDANARLQAELATERETVSRLQGKCTEQGQLIASLWEKAFPREKVTEDLKNYPPLEKCHSFEGLVIEMRELSQAVKEQRGS
jgi:hypothetical protein